MATFLSGIVSKTRFIVSRTKAGVLSFAGTVSGSITGAYAASVEGVLSFSGVVGRLLLSARTVTGVLTLAGAVTKEIIVSALETGVLDFSGAVNRVLVAAHPTTGTLTFAGTSTGVKSGDATRSVSGVLSFIGAVVRSLIAARTKTGALSLTGTVSGHKAGDPTLYDRTVLGELSFTGSYERNAAIARSVSGETDFIGGLSDYWREELYYGIRNDTAVAAEYDGSFREIFKPSTGDLTTDECMTTVINNYGQSVANEQTFPTCAQGMSGTFVIGTEGAGAFSAKAGPDDKLYIDGTATDDGDKASIATPGLGDSMSFLSFKDGTEEWDWLIISGPGTTVTDGGA